MAEETTSPEQAPKKKLPIKTLAIIAGVLLLEMATAFGVYMMAGGANGSDAAVPPGFVLPDHSNDLVEELVIEDRFANSKQGPVFMYDTQIYIKVKLKFQPKVQELLKSMNASITADVATIFRRAEPSYMHEDALQTLTRQIKEVLDQRLLDDEKKSMVEAVMITRCHEYRADF